MHIHNYIRWRFFWVNVLIIWIICVCSGIGMVDNRTVSIIEVLAIGHEGVRMSTTWLDAFSVIRYGNLYLAIPLITSIATLPLTCDEIRTNNYQFHISRIGFKKYVNQRYLAVLLSGCGAMLIAFVLLGIFLYCNFPSSPDFGNSEVIGLVEQSLPAMLLSALWQAVFVLCWGGMAAIFSCGMVGFSQNIYVILCVPFLLNYLSAPYLRELNIPVLICLSIFFYYVGRRVWIRCRQGVGK